MLRYQRHTGRVKGPGLHIAGISQRPTGHHRVIGEDQDSGEAGEDAQRDPSPRQERPVAGAPDGGQGTAPAVTAQHHLRNHHRHRDQEEAEHIGDHEGAATMLADKVRETPEITETDR